MKILHINSYYSVSGFYKSMYDKQKTNGMDIEVYVPVVRNFNNETLDIGEYTTLSKNHGRFDRYLFHIKHKKIYNDCIQTYDIRSFSLLHAHSLFSNGYIAYKVKEEYDIPYIVAVRNTDVNVFFKYMAHLRKLGLKVLKEAENVVFLSQSYRDFLLDKYIPENLRDEISSKSIVIPNGIDDFWLQNKGTSRDIKQKKIKLLGVGIIDKNKNQVTTVKAIEILQKKGYKIKYTVVGRIRNQKVYEKIKDLPYVEYIAPKQKEDLVNIYRENDMFVMPSKTETFGLVYPEAMSQGLPVVYTRGQGFDGQFDEGEVGYPVNCMDAKEIADRIITIINNYSEISKRCIQLSARFDWQKIIEEYKRIYSIIS